MLLHSPWFYVWFATSLQCHTWSYRTRWECLQVRHLGLKSMNVIKYVCVSMAGWYNGCICNISPCALNCLDQDSVPYKFLSHCYVCMSIHTNEAYCRWFTYQLYHIYPSRKRSLEYLYNTKPFCSRVDIITKAQQVCCILAFVLLYFSVYWLSYTPQWGTADWN